MTSLCPPGSFPVKPVYKPLPSRVPPTQWGLMICGHDCKHLALDLIFSFPQFPSCHRALLPLLGSKFSHLPLFLQWPVLTTLQIKPLPPSLPSLKLHLKYNLHPGIFPSKLPTGHDVSLFWLHLVSSACMDWRYNLWCIYAIFSCCPKRSVSIMSQCLVECLACRGAQLVFLEWTTYWGEGDRYKCCGPDAYIY